MKPDFDTALDNCLDWLRAGMNLQTCLERYPQYAGELRPLLEVGMDLSTVVAPPLSAAVRAAGRRRVLETFEKKSCQPISKPALSRYAVQITKLLTGKEPQNMKLAWPLTTVIVVAVLTMTSAATVVASTPSLPGDALYPVKMTVQKARVALTFDATAREELEERFAAQQRQDVQTVLETGRQARVEFQGVLQQIKDSTWIVGGLPVMLQADTIVEGQPQLGVVVGVRGRLPGDGSLVASQLTVDEPAPGTFDSSLPTPEPEVQPTETLRPTETPEPTEALEPDETPEPTETLEPTGTPEPTETPEPEETEEPEDSDDSDGLDDSDDSDDPDDSDDSDDPDDSADDSDSSDDSDDSDNSKDDSDDSDDSDNSDDSDDLDDTDESEDDSDDSDDSQLQ